MSNQERRRRRQHNDRTHDDAPHPDAVADAMRDAFESLARGEPEVPDWGTLTTLAEFADAPYRLGEGVVITHVGLTDGQPRNGALMSDSHVSGFEAEFPHPCPDCVDGHATLDFSRHHNIAVRRDLTCNCGHVHDAEEW